MRGATEDIKAHLANPEFQSTRPVRGATANLSGIMSLMLVFQSTRPVRGATLGKKRFPALILFQSTRPVRGATVNMVVQWRLVMFQSTRPVRGATMAEPRVADED